MKEIDTYKKYIPHVKIWSKNLKFENQRHLQNIAKKIENDRDRIEIDFQCHLLNIKISL